MQVQLCPSITTGYFSLTGPDDRSIYSTMCFIASVRNKQTTTHSWHYVAQATLECNRQDTARLYVSYSQSSCPGCTSQICCTSPATRTTAHYHTSARGIGSNYTIWHLFLVIGQLSLSVDQTSQLQFQRTHSTIAMRIFQWQRRRRIPLYWCRTLSWYFVILLSTGNTWFPRFHYLYTFVIDIDVFTTLDRHHNYIMTLSAWSEHSRYSIHYWFPDNLDLCHHDIHSWTTKASRQTSYPEHIFRVWATTLNKPRTSDSCFWSTIYALRPCSAHSTLDLSFTERKTSEYTSQHTTTSDS